ncbi:hypothetical protein [Clostridium estertheticum]|uniref:hypothetical protein n=1 Tax=Clostridium estertheticum TaxID=238834 RepID=UPI001C7D6A4B|nr:hypothetical protein [Clostridium estertheticum]MBX4266575.1 hypothetical protein [Clostridium estertheticum]WLC88085.1 hypothetical protein KTC95_19020 [Clostridium estertheticum]
MEKQLKEIMEQLKYCNIDVVKKDGWIKFRMRNKQDKVITTLRCYSNENFNPKSEWFVSTETMVKYLKADYNYVVSYRLDCQ